MLQGCLTMLKYELGQEYASLNKNVFKGFLKENIELGRANIYGKIFFSGHAGLRLRKLCHSASDYLIV